MSWSIKSTYKPKERGYDEGCDNPVEPVVAHGDKQPEEWEPPSTSQDIRPGEEEKDEGASSFQVGNIFRRVKSTYRPRKRSYDQAFVNPVVPVVAHGDKQPQEWEPPTSSQDIRPGEAKEDEGASAVEVGNIFRRVKSTYRPRKRIYDQACVNPVGPVVAHGDKQPQGWEPPTTSQDIRPGKAKEDEGASAVEGPVPEADQREVAKPKTRRERGRGFNGKRLPKPEPF
ncbi:uncharacterized protein LOC105071332 [Camelus bactrianus]|uniref:Uncharacterized protein LOC105071332 n=4 Tax=Camelus bactrianus TaxID=9837 RepID=A0AC58PZF4_CAMBA